MSRSLESLPRLVLPGFLILAFLPSLPGAFFSPGAWFATLEKPWFNPPGWIFGPVWTVLYAMIGLSGWFYWKADRLTPSRSAWGVYGAQLTLNAAWSCLFFGGHWIGWALVDCILLTCLILANAVLFHRKSRKAGWLLVPYLVWTGFASVLNGAFWSLNH